MRYTYNVLNSDYDPPIAVRKEFVCCKLLRVPLPLISYHKC